MLFCPTDKRKTLKDQYSELGTIDEIKDLSVSEGAFVWAVACKSSSLANPESEGYIKDFPLRCQTAVGLMVKEGYQIDSADKSAWSNGSLSPVIRAAVTVMGKFDPDARKRGANAIDSIYENLIRISGINILDYIDKTDAGGNRLLDTSAMNSYASAAEKVADLLPKIIKMKEDNMGINDSISADLKSGKSANALFMEKQRLKAKNA